MAPHKFWMKRQLPDLPGGLDDALPGIPSLPLPSPSSTTSSATSPTPTSSSTSQSSRSTASSTSTRAPARPTQSATEEEEEPVESQVDTSPTPTSEGILVTPAPTPTSVITDLIASSERLSTSTLVSRTVVLDGPAATSGAPAKVGAAKGNAFLENKVLSGVVFAICGVVGLVIIGFIIWMATRKARQTKKLEQEIISWDPDHVRGFNNASTTHASKDAETRSLDALEEKRGPGSLDGHFNTYTLPSQSVHAGGQNKPAASGPYSDYYGGQRPIQVTLPPGEGQPYRANW